MTYPPIDIRLRIEREVEAADAAYHNAQRNLAFRELGQRVVRAFGASALPGEAVRAQRALDTMVDNAAAEHAAALAEIAERYEFNPTTGRFTFDADTPRDLVVAAGGWCAPLGAMAAMPYSVGAL